VALALAMFPEIVFIRCRWATSPVVLMSMERNMGEVQK
jgi:hypothetical protein